MWAGIAGSVANGGSVIEIALSVHDSVYSTDFASASIPYSPNDPEKTAADIERLVIQTLKNFSNEHLCKFLGAGVTLTLLKEVCFCTESSFSLLILIISPPICARGYGWIWTLSRSSSTSSHIIPNP